MLTFILLSPVSLVCRRCARPESVRAHEYVDFLTNHAAKIQAFRNIFFSGVTTFVNRKKISYKKKKVVTPHATQVRTHLNLKIDSILIFKKFTTTK